MLTGTGSKVGVISVIVSEGVKETDSHGGRSGKVSGERGAKNKKVQR